MSQLRDCRRSAKRKRNRAQPQKIDRRYSMCRELLGPFASFAQFAAKIFPEGSEVMNSTFERLKKAYESDRISRRRLLFSLPALMMAPAALAQTSNPPIRVKGINHVTLSVSDVKRSVDFYQGLFGMSVISRQGTTATNLQIGAGPQFLGVSAAGSSGPRINHLCLGVENFNVDRLIGILGRHGITKNDAAGPMQVRVRMRGLEAGGAREGTPELSFGDPDGIVIQLQDSRYCGGAGALGNGCPRPEP